MFRLIVVCFLLMACSLTGCGKEGPKEVKSIRKMDNLKKLSKK
jgi:predicted small lipoprotein YifL